jgi:transcriptional regulator with AAA-type ATPase domain
MTESLTKEERIQLSTRWPPDTKLYLKLLRVHDENVGELKAAIDHIGHLGHGEVIDVLTENGVGFTSYRGDAAWDTTGNRKRIRDRYHAQSEELSRVAGAARNALVLLEDHSTCREQQASEVLRAALESK